MKKSMRGYGMAVTIMLIVLVAVLISNSIAGMGNSYSYQNYVKDLESKTIKKVVISQNEEAPTGKVTVTMQDGSDKSFYVVNTETAWNAAMEAGCDPVVLDVSKPNWLLSLLPNLLLIIVMVVMFNMMMGAQAGGANSKLMNFGKSRAKMILNNDGTGTKFHEVAGVEEEKEELSEIVDFLKNPKKYTQLGAKIPKGVILVGPPGTGKTLLAKAVAGEAGVPFFSISGSDFCEMYVGVGASRVRDLFADAKKHAPCIVFIDEIDAVARRRGSGMGGGHDEREQTLNQMLVEMDGFDVNEGIIVMAATNRVDILDPAILRPGRFDRKVYVNLPDTKGREAILAVHAKGKPLADDVDLKRIAQSTSGFSGADLENLLNEAALGAAKEDRPFVREEDIKKALIKVGIGLEKKSRIVSDKEREITAYHEAGHAILFHVLPDVGPVYTVSIIPTGASAAGYTMPLPGEDKMFRTRGRMLQDIMVSLGGRIAEELIFDDVTTGASEDIRHVTKLARAMVTKYGFSKQIGLVSYDNEDDEILVGRDFAQTKAYSEATANSIDGEIRKLVEECYEKAKEILMEHQDVLHRCAEELLKKDRIGKDEFEALFG